MKPGVMAGFDSREIPIQGGLWRDLFAFRTDNNIHDSAGKQAKHKLRNVGIFI